MAKLVSNTYGEALFELAVEEKKLDAIEEEVKAVLAAMAENEDLLRLLNHPKIAKEEKIKVVEDIFKGRISDELVGFLVIIVDKGRYNEINAIFDYFLNKVKEYKNIGVAFVTSAVELSEEQKQQVEQRLLQTTKYERFEMNYKCDSSLIGGMVIRIGDRVVDSSIRTQIAMMSKELMKVQL